jgi:hypothetical protein
LRLGVSDVTIVTCDASDITLDDENLTQDKIPQHWLLLIYRVPQDPPGRRTYVWRQLKNLGAIYLQQAAAILPDRPEVRAALVELTERIQAFQGEASLLETVSPDASWEESLVQRFNQARDAEYAEVENNVERLEDEVRRESRKGKFTFAQLEDIESDWEKLQRWHQRISARNFFGAPGESGAAAALERGRAALESFSAQVYAHEGVDEQGSGSQPEEDD